MGLKRSTEGDEDNKWHASNERIINSNWNWNERWTSGKSGWWRRISKPIRCTVGIYWSYAYAKTRIGIGESVETGVKTINQYLIIK